jgi:hypothetical protein
MPLTGQMLVLGDSGMLLAFRVIDYRDRLVPALVERDVPETERAIR